MKRFSYLDSRRGQMVLALFLAAQLYFARDTLVTTSLVGFAKAQLLAVALTGLLGAGFLMANRGRLTQILRDDRVFLMGIAAAIFLVPMLLKRDWQLMYFSILYCVLLGIFLTYFTSSRELARCYVVMITALAAFSVLATYVLRRPVDSGSVAVPVLYNALDVKFYNFILTFVSESYVKNRNFGIFREPGVYQYFLILGLYLNNYEVRWDSEKKLWAVNILLAVTTVSTFATGGLVELALLVVVLFFDKGWYRKKAGKLAGTVILLGGAVTVYSFATKGLLYAGIMDALSKFDPNHESMTDRAGSIMENTKILLRHPLLGGGIREVLYVVANNTSSSTILYAVLGILGGTLNAAAWVALTWREDRKLWAWLAVTVILFMSFNTENYITNPYFWLFPVMAVCQRVLPAIGSGKNRA